MAKKNKNSNYVTDKTVAAKAAAEAEAKKKSRQKFIKTWLIPSFAVGALIGVIIAVCAIFGAFDYVPEATSHLSMTLSDGTTLHIELYGDDAPETVAHIEKLAGSNYFKDRSILSVLDGSIFMGDDEKDGGTQGIKGEFKENGVKNKVKHTRGTLSMARAEDFNSAYGQFFIVTEDNEELDGKYAAFGRITDGLEDLEAALEDAIITEEGVVLAGAPTITSISTHASH